MATEQFYGTGRRKSSIARVYLRKGKGAITVNKQLIPDDPKPPLRPSGIRLGTPAATTRGLGVAEMDTLAQWIVDALGHHQDEERLAALRASVEEFCLGYAVPGLAELET